MKLWIPIEIGVENKLAGAVFPSDAYWLRNLAKCFSSCQEWFRPYFTHHDPGFRAEMKAAAWPDNACAAFVAPMVKGDETEGKSVRATGRRPSRAATVVGTTILMHSLRPPPPLAFLFQCDNACDPHDSETLRSQPLSAAAGATVPDFHLPESDQLCAYAAQHYESFIRLSDTHAVGPPT